MQQSVMANCIILQYGDDTKMKMISSTINLSPKITPFLTPFFKIIYILMFYTLPLELEMQFFYFYVGIQCFFD